MLWDDDATAKVLELWNDGKTGSEIGTVFGTSRNAVIGLIHRLRERKGINIRRHAGNTTACKIRRREIAQQRWTEDQTNLLIDLWNRGRSYRHIADALGVTGHRVRSKVEWLREEGVELKVHASHNPYGFPAALRGRKSKPTAPVHIEEVIVSIPDDPARLGAPNAVMGLSRSQCKYPLGNPQGKTFHFCCAPSRENGPYCEAHHRIAYTGLPPSSSAHRPQRRAA